MNNCARRSFWESVFGQGFNSPRLHYQAEPGRNSRSRFSFFILLFRPRLCRASILPTFPTPAVSKSRIVGLFIIKFCARVYVGHLFCRHFPAANCRRQYARFTFVESILFCPRLCRASILPTFPTPAVSKSRTVGFFIIKFCARVYVGYLFC